MSKKGSVGCPWEAPDQALPMHGEQVFACVSDGDERYMAVAVFNATRGWNIPMGDTFLTSEWRVEFWMRIPPNPPF